MTQTTPQKTRRNPAQTLDALLTRIAQEHLFIDTLETRNSDSMDFHDVSVWAVLRRFFWVVVWVISISVLVCGRVCMNALFGAEAKLIPAISHLFLHQPLRRGFR